MLGGRKTVSKEIATRWPTSLSPLSWTLAPASPQPPPADDQGIDSNCLVCMCGEGWRGEATARAVEIVQVQQSVHVGAQWGKKHRVLSRRGDAAVSAIRTHFYSRSVNCGQQRRGTGLDYQNIFVWKTAAKQDFGLLFIFILLLFRKPTNVIYILKTNIQKHLIFKYLTKIKYELIIIFKNVDGVTASKLFTIPESNSLLKQNLLTSNPYKLPNVYLQYQSKHLEKTSFCEGNKNDWFVLNDFLRKFIKMQAK